MKIFFSAAQTLDGSWQANYHRITACLAQAGHAVYQIPPDQDNTTLYNQVLTRLSTCDVVVMEVSSPSTLQIGHQLTVALEKHKPVIALYAEGQEPSFFIGYQNPLLIWTPYTNQTLETELTAAMQYATDQQDVRFNLLLSAKMNQYLGAASQELQVSKSHFIRSLILAHKQKQNH